MATIAAPPRGVAIPEKENLRGNIHLYESLKKLELWSQQVGALLASFAFPGDASLFLDGTGHFSAPDVDGGSP